MLKEGKAYMIEREKIDIKREEKSSIKNVQREKRIEKVNERD